MSMKRGVDVSAASRFYGFRMLFISSGSLLLYNKYIFVVI